MNNCCNNECSGHCNIDLSEDDGYQYIIDELKDVRKRCDRIINLLEKRTEKNNIIDEVLSNDCEEEDNIDIKEYVEALRVINNFPYDTIWHTNYSSPFLWKKFN